MSSLSLLIKISFFFSLARLGFGTGGKSTLMAIAPLSLSRERGGKRGGGENMGCQEAPSVGFGGKAKGKA